MSRIAIVGMACRYPDAASPRELWENAVAGRRAFRRLPDVRMRLEDHWDADPAAEDRFYAREAAVLEGYAFDRVAHKVAGSTYRSTDLTHWLALDVAGRALADAGFPQGEGLPRERTGVVVGNTLTGEFARANVMRLRWPYVRRVMAAALREQDWDDDRLTAFLDDVEAAYKSPFPAVDEDTLAGGLSNTIAGRVCNHFDLGGGGYTVDGACSSSLLSVTTAASSLLAGDIDVAVAGGVDLSIDPFEITGFAKTGALARHEMKVYDKAANGFWPGEGCGMVVLMREADALAAGHRVYATVAGWGVSSDGQGGITRPEVAGYQLALRRAYERAGFGIQTVPLFEGHGTGTAVGDTTELRALMLARTTADPEAAPAVISSIKAMIGHTKAAAGVAGLIKAAMAVDARMLPPAIGCTDPHELLTAPSASLRVLRRAEPWPDGAPLRAGVTAMGFGGINTHVVLDKPGPHRHPVTAPRDRILASSAQDAELLLVDGDSPQELGARLDRLTAFVPQLAYAELADLAATLQRELRDAPYRAAAVVSSPADAERRLRQLRDAVEAGETSLVAADGRAFLGRVSGPGRIGFLFPGQGSGNGTSGGALGRRLAEAAQVYERAELPAGGDMVATAVAQPRIVTGSLAGLRALRALGVEATVAVGHSLGEISALHWAGAMDEETLLRVAAVRGRAMTEHSDSGTMASLAASPEAVGTLTAGLPVVVAGYNGPERTVVAGPAEAVEEVERRARDAGTHCVRLPVSHAFHSPLVAPAADAFGTWLAGVRFAPPARRIVSTVTGRALAPGTDVPDLLRRQITEPVLFAQAVELAAKDVCLFVEVGPGRVLSQLAAAATDVPAVALDTDDESLRGLLQVAGAAWVAGSPLAHERLFHDRLVRPLEIGAELRFLASPCEQAPPAPARGTRPAPARAADPQDAPAGRGTDGDENTGEPAAGLLRRLVAERAELPEELVGDDSRLLDDLHLSSITVGQLVNRAAQRLGIPPAQVPTNFATATVGELSEALQALAGTGRPAEAAAPVVAGAAPWARAFAPGFDEPPLPARTAPEAGGPWRLFTAPGTPHAERLRTALESAEVGPGVLVWLPPDCPYEQLERALEGARAALADEGAGRFVLVQHGRGAAGLAKTLHLEAPHLRTTVVHVPEETPEAVGWVVAETAATTRFAEAHYDADGTRRVPVLRALPIAPARTEQPLGEEDVLLVTGGGKGISAECALAIAVGSSARLAVLGRSDPGEDPELAANLRRMADSGVTVRYARADLADAGRTRAAVEELTRELGPVTAVLHGAGRNEPTALTGLDMAEFRRTFAPKVDGLRNLLDALEPERLRLLVAFGSVIGRSGLRGEAHYATANEWLTDLTEGVARRHPHLRALCLEWSVWSGVGMGERLSVVESLAREGITPISPDRGVEILLRLIADPDAPTTVVVTGRTEGVGTMRHDLPPLPLLRFAGRPLVRYHGVELVTEVELNAGTDPYLADHLLDGDLLFPAVLGLEAMTQVATAATGWTAVPVVERAEFLRPVVVPPDGSTTIRVAATVTGPETVDVAVHSEETGFAAEHFRARLVFSGAAVPQGPPLPAAGEAPPVPLDPAADLYGDVLFQGTRFQRLRRFHRAAARHVDADVATAEPAGWFAGFLPARLLLGDPGMRDALMHGNQVCVPDATLLPAGIERVHPLGGGEGPAGELRYCAVERERDGDTYVYDIAVRDERGEVVERWEGLRLRAVRRRDGSGPWAAPLLGPYLERALEDVLDARIAVAVEPAAGEDDRRARTALALERALGHPAEVRHRPDGRPETDGHSLSASHGAGVTLCAVADDEVACDVETVTARTAADWDGLLGDHAPLAALLAGQTGEDHDSAATRVWCALECLKKAGVMDGAPLTLDPGRRDGWAVLASGGLRIATFVTALRDEPRPVVLAFLTGGSHG
ncbi:SDR family NAD(P)-dependent oxidoreductase [Streptomyces sp. NPDC053048]|uniref:type I polyketide synthase n=1 Tax=Streptomyces sp. NPDC053048 TaxID=3365694 RepID=UPI0037D874AE